jgi:hypothetical protein
LPRLPAAWAGIAIRPAVASRVDTATARGAISKPPTRADEAAARVEYRQIALQEPWCYPNGIGHSPHAASAGSATAEDVQPRRLWNHGLSGAGRHPPGRPGLEPSDVSHLGSERSNRGDERWPQPPIQRLRAQGAPRPDVLAGSLLTHGAVLLQVAQGLPILCRERLPGDLLRLIW